MMAWSLLVMLTVLLLPFGKPINPKPLPLTLLLVFISMLLGWGFANTTLPSVKKERFMTRYRYKHFIDVEKHDVGKVADFIIANKLFNGHYNAGHSTEARKRGKNFHEYRFVRLNDMMLVKMRF